MARVNWNAVQNAEEAGNRLLTGTGSYERVPSEKQGFERPDVPMQGYKGMWSNPQVVGQAYDLLKNQPVGTTLPDWMTQDVQDAIGTAAEWYTRKYGSDDWNTWQPLAEDDPLNAYLSQLPEPQIDVQQAQPEQTVSQPAPTAFQIQHYGYTEQEWANLPQQYKVYADLIASPTAAMTATGALAGIGGGPGGIAAGAAVANVMGRLSQKYVWMAKLGEILDLGAEFLERVPGAVGIATEAAQRGEKLDIGAAWKAARFTYEATPLLEDITGQDVKAWNVGEKQDRTLAKAGQYDVEAELYNIYDMFRNNKSADEIQSYVQQRYGAQGMVRDTLGHIFIDVLPFVGGWSSKGLGAVGKMLGASDEFVAAFKGGKVGGIEIEGATGPIQAVKRFKVLADQVPFEDWQAWSKIEKGLSNTFTPEGVPTISAIPDPKNAIARGWGYMWGLTKEARAREFVNIYSHNTIALADRAGMDAHKYMDYLKLMSNNNTEAAARLGLKVLGGATATAGVPVMKDVIPELEKLLANFDAYKERGYHDVLARLSDLTKRDMLDIVKKLGDKTEGAKYAQMYANRLGDAAWTADKLSELGKLMKDQPVSEKMLLGQMYKTQIEAAGRYAVDWYGVSPDNPYVRTSNLIKKAQSWLLLTLSPRFTIANTMDNTWKLAREGALGFVMPGKAGRVLDDFYGAGMWPKSVGEGALSEFGRGAQDAISAAKRVQGKGIDAGGAQKVPAKPKWIDKIGAWNPWIEQGFRKHGTASRISQGMNHNWKVESGFGRMSKELADAIGRDKEAWAYRAVENNWSYDKIKSALLGDEIVRNNASMEVGTAARRLNMDDALAKDTLQELGVLDYLTQKLPVDADDLTVRKVFADAIEDARKNLEQINKDALLREMEIAKATETVEGSLGVARALNELVIEAAELRIQEVRQTSDLFMRWDSLTPEQRAIEWKNLRRWQNSNRENFNRTKAAMYAGAFDTYGASLPGQKYINYEKRIDDLWADFYGKRDKAHDTFFKDKEAGKFENSEIATRTWEELQDAMDTLYAEASKKALDLQAKRDNILVALVGERHGGVQAQAVKDWLDRMRMYNAESFEAVKTQWANVREVPTDLANQGVTLREYKNQMFRDFWENKYIPGQLEKMAESTAHAKTLWRNVTEAMRKAEPVKPADMPEVEPITRASDEMLEAARLDVMKRTFSMTPEQFANFNEIRRLAAEAGIASKEGVDRAWNQHILRLVNSEKYGGTKGQYALVQDIPLDVLRERLARRAEVKAAEAAKKGLAGEIEPAEYHPLTLDDALVERLALVKEQQAAKANLDEWRRKAGAPKQEEAPAAAEMPDPIGDAPPATIQNATPEPLSRIFKEGWNSTVYPLIKELEAAMLSDEAKRPAKVKVGDLSPEMQKEFVAWVNGLQGNLSSMKHNVSKLAELSVNDALLNYSRQTGADQLVGLLVPYQFWYTRNALNWAANVIDRPFWYAEWYRLRELQEKNQVLIEGYPSRLEGKMRLRIPAHWMPDGWGDTIYFDPLHQTFGFEGMYDQLARPLYRDESNRMARAQYNLQNMARTGEITDKQMVDALRNQEDPLWIQAYEEAGMQIDANIEHPIDYLSAILSPSLPISWFLEKVGLKSHKNFGPLPAIATLQDLTSFMTPGGVNLVEVAKKVAGGKVTGKDRGDIYPYFVMREMRNQVVRGADVKQAIAQMADGQGDLWTQAVDQVGKQGAIKGLGSIFWMDFFPEEEAQILSMKGGFIRAAEEGKLNEWFDQNQAYEAQLAAKKWENPEDILRSFLISGIWDGRYAADKLAKDATDAALGEDFKTLFLSKETRAYDQIPTEQLVTWARAYDATIPKSAPEGENVQIDMPAQTVRNKYSAYQEARNALFPNIDLLQDMYWSLSEAAQEQFEVQYPELARYQEWRDRLIAANPDLMPYLIGKDSALAGAPFNIQQAAYQYKAERASLYPGILIVQNEYYASGKSKSYLNQHPELKDYWDWNRAYKVMHPELEPYLWQSKETQGKQPVTVDLKTMTAEYPALKTHLELVPVGGRLTQGDLAMLQLIYERVQPRMNFTEWLNLQGISNY